MRTTDHGPPPRDRGQMALFVLAVMVVTSRCGGDDPTRHMHRGGGATVGSTERRQPMDTSAVPSPDDNTIEASVTIQRPVDTVFGFYRDFRNLPRFLGDVMAVEQIGPATSRWTIQGPLGIRAHWTIRVTEERPNELIRYETVTSAPLRTYWEIQFTPAGEAGETRVRERMKAPLGRLGRTALALIGKFPAQEVSSNLHRLKQLMETGSVTDTSYAVAGKFAQRPSPPDPER
jgi:uncharacterized membrane protein